MKIIKNKVPTPKSEYPKSVECIWCKSELEIEKEDLRRDSVIYSQREIDHNITGFDCPCCHKFSPM